MTSCGQSDTGGHFSKMDCKERREGGREGGKKEEEDNADSWDTFF